MTLEQSIEMRQTHCFLRNYKGPGKGENAGPYSSSLKKDALS